MSRVSKVKEMATNDGHREPVGLNNKKMAEYEQLLIGVTKCFIIIGYIFFTFFLRSKLNHVKTRDIFLN